jgi:pyruvate/2-oxoglutarate dehydrogenase complex dihydrolipoamide dehydrogenase (E3) component
MGNDVDVVVLGLGPGGESVATKLADAGLRVVGVDERLVGGECPYFGCVPSKMMIRPANLLAEGRRVPGMAGDSELTPDWGRVAARISEEATDGWDDKVAVERLEKAGVTFVRGHGRLTAERTVEIDGRSYTAERGVVLNTGTEPAVPPIDGLGDTPYWTNRDAVQVRDLPASLVVIGGGAIGAEMCQAFARFGVQVTLLEVAERILAPEEPEASRLVADVLGREGVQVLAGVQIESVGYGDGRFSVALEDQTVHADKLLVATGRRTNLADIGLDTVGVGTDGGSIAVDGRMRVAPGLWAIGDITGKGAFTHISMYQAAIATRDILGEDGPEADYRAVPRVTFTDPEIGSVGLTEEAARNQGLGVRIGVTRLPESTRGWIHQAGNDGFVKLVEDAERGVLVGATSAGPCGGEVLSMLTTAVHAGVPTESLKSMIYAYPTFHRAVEDALGRLK